MTTNTKSAKPTPRKRPDPLAKLLRQIDKELAAGQLVTICPAGRPTQAGSLTKKKSGMAGRAMAYRYETRSEGHAIRAAAETSSPGEIVTLGSWGTVTVEQLRRVAAHNRLTVIVTREGRRASYTGRLAQHLSDCIVAAAYAFDAGEAYAGVAPGVLTYAEFMERAVGVEVKRLA